MAGLVVGLLVAGALAYVDPDALSSEHEPPEETRFTGTEEEVNAFLADWRRSRLGTWTIEATYSRKQGKEVSTSSVLETQRPPDYLLSGLGSVRGRDATHEYACSDAEESGTVCTPGDAVPSWDVMVALEMDALKTNVLASPPPYGVRRTSDDCYRLTRLRPMLSGSFGDRARICFDPATGARTLHEVHQGEIVTTTRATRVTATVNEAVFEAFKR